MTKIVERAVDDMCSLGMGVYLDGKREGKIDGKREARLDAIKKIMKNFKCSIEQAMDTLELTQDEKVMYSKLLEESLSNKAKNTTV
jgi:predicted transposase YdaD